MRKNYLLINETDIKAFSVVADNLDAKYIAPSIIAAQDVYLEPQIGSKLMDKLGGLIADGTLDENPMYKELLETYVQPYLLHKTISEIMVQSFAKIRNTGIVQFNDTNQTSNTLQDVNFIRRHYDDMAVTYAQRMTDFLFRNKDSFPEYSCKCNADGGEVGAGGSQSNNFCGIHF